MMLFTQMFYMYIHSYVYNIHFVRKIKIFLHFHAFLRARDSDSCWDAEKVF